MEEQPDIDLGAGGSDGGLPEPGKDVFAEVEPDLSEEPQEGRLGGDGATLEELEAEAEQAEEPAEEPSPEPEPEPTAEAPEEAVAPAPEEKAAPASEDEPAKGEQKPEPEPAPKATKKVGTADREYVVLQETSEKVYEEVLDPIRAGNGEAAIREAYAKLVPGESEDSVTLVVVPSHFWKPKTVKAKAKVNRAIEID